VVELALDGGQVVKDVGVVELQVVQDGRARAVVDELAALVEEGGVVLVGFDDETGGGGETAQALLRVPRPLCGLLLDLRKTLHRPATQAGRDPEIHRHAADQEARLAGQRFPESRPASTWWWSCHGCRPRPARGGLAARARPATAGRWCRARRRPDGFHERELRRAVGLAGAADHVADDKHVGLERHLAGVEAFDQFDAQGAQLVAHGRVDAGVAAGHGVAGFTGQGGQAAHEGAADAENVDVHQPILGSFHSFFCLIPSVEWS
jgi:hypothetical protein